MMNNKRYNGGYALAKLAATKIATCLAHASSQNEKKSQGTKSGDAENYDRFRKSVRSYRTTTSIPHRQP